MELIRSIASASTKDQERIVETLSRPSRLLSAAAPTMAPFDFQAAYMDSQRRFIIVRKPRQIGASWMISAKHLLKALGLRGYRAIFVSINLNEAKEKINYARDIYYALSETLPVPELTVDNQLEIGFSNGSRLVCQFTPRGRSRSDIVMDEFAHMQNADEVYRASIPILVHGGHLTISSTPIHVSTLYEHIWNREGGRYGSFKRVQLCWWDSPMLCNDVKAARKEAKEMSTEERIARFGTEMLKEVFDSMSIDDFHVEFELRTLSEDEAFLPWSLIVSCTPTGEQAIEPCKDIEELIQLANGRPMAFGYDVGRRRDSGELAVFVESADSRTIEERYIRRFTNEPFDAQESALKLLLRRCDCYGAIDSTGMGEMMAEHLHEEFGDRVIPFNFSSNTARGTLAATIKLLMERREVLFVADRNRSAQMHSLRRRVTESDNVRLVAVREKDAAGHVHHADVFWARALAVYSWHRWRQAGPVRIRFI